jgi:hypothetical protein
MEVRNCFLVPSGGFRPGFPAGFLSAISLPVRCALPETVPWVAGCSKGLGPPYNLFPRQLAAFDRLQDVLSL